jgi:hypothetical protein
MKKANQIIFLCLLMSSTMMLASCKQPVKSTVVNSNQTQYQDKSPQVIAVKKETIKFKRDGGAEAFSLKSETNEAKLVDGNEKELARFNIDDRQKIKIKSKDNQSLGYVVIKDGVWKIKNASQDRELYILRRQEDGDYKLVDGAAKEIYRVKVRPYGFEIESATKQSIYKVKIKDSKTSLRNKSDQTILYTKSLITPIAIACFGFDILTQEQKAALAYALTVSGG